MIDSALARELFKLSKAQQWGLSTEQFAETLARSAAKAEATTAAYLRALHLEDLALACACAAGINAAWEHFIREFRPTLYRAAAAIDPHGNARDLADSIYAELFGLTERHGERQSLFRYFHGRSSLATWLRTVLAQRHIDRVRAARKVEPLPDDESAHPLSDPAPPGDPQHPLYLSLVTHALSRGLDALAPRDRLRLACYYAQELTLAQIGTLLGEHEATTSRHLARARKAIRADVERDLRSEHGLGDAAIAECFRAVAGDAGPLDLRRLFASDASTAPRPDERKKSEPDRSKVSEDMS